MTDRGETRHPVSSHLAQQGLLDGLSGVTPASYAENRLCRVNEQDLLAAQYNGANRAHEGSRRKIVTQTDAKLQRNTIPLLAPTAERGVTPEKVF